MCSARLFSVALLLSSSWILAQEDQHKTAQLQDEPGPTSVSQTGGDTSGIDQLRSTPSAVPQDPLLRLQSAQVWRFALDPNTEFKMFPANNRRNFVFAPDLVPADAFCLKIRSYLMARDHRGTDSTHLVGYSTCQPASRYRLRTAVGSTETERSR